MSDVLFKLMGACSGVSAAPPDTQPDAFTFTDQTDVPVSSARTSNTITVAGMDAGASATVTVTGGTYSKNSGAHTSASGTAQNGDTFAVRHTSSASNSTATNTTLTIGGVNDTFTSTTEAAASDVTPNAIDFPNINVVNGSGTTNTATRTITGINTTITLRVVTANGGGDHFEIRPRVDGSFVTTAQNSPANFTFTISNNQTLNFFLETADRSDGPGTVTITNVSDSNATIDTFNVALEVD